MNNIGIELEDESENTLKYQKRVSVSQMYNYSTLRTAALKESFTFDLFIFFF